MRAVLGKYGFQSVIVQAVVFIILLSLQCYPCCAHEPKQVLVVAYADNEPYSQVINSFETQLNAEFTEIFNPNADTIAKAILVTKPKLIFALGREITELVQQHSTTIPIISTLVINEEVFKKATNTTGINLAYPFSIQLHWLKQLLPEQTRVAVLFNPVENADTVAGLKQTMAHIGLELKGIEVKTLRELPDALEQLANDVDVLLSIPDEITLSPKTAKEVLLASFRNRVPMVGLSENWVKSGALYALSWDYDDLGKQCAIQAQKLLNGQMIKNIPPEIPRKITYVINTKIAEHMNITIADRWRNQAKITFD